jgi:2',3'-cyclic-nucleotide 2'-phosphodiesterase (5'-nucleotidase family)
MKTMKDLLVLSVLVLSIGFLAIVESCNNDNIETTTNEPGITPDGGKSVTIDIYSFTDFHGVMDSSEDPINPGAARFIAVAKKLMSQSEHSMLLSSGDNYHNWEYDAKGDTNMSNIFRGNPVSDMMKMIGLKYSVIGNHEWDWGEKFAEYSEEGGITYLAANIFLKGTDNRPGFCQPYVIETIAGRKIGIVGLTITAMELYTDTFDSEDFIDGYEFRGMGPWLKDMVTDLKSNQGCDAVIALTHLDEQTLADLVGNNDKGFDAIILGHTHRITNRKSYGVPTVQASHYGRGLAKLSFIFDDNGLVSVTHDSFRNFLDDTYLPANIVDEEIAAMVASYRERMENP